MEALNRTARRPRRFALALLLASIAVAAAAYGGTAGASAGKHGTRALVKLRKTSLGRVLVDRRGRTLYLFEADKGRKSVCYGACAKAWPPLLTNGSPIARAGVRARMLGTTRRKGGKLQVTYHGHPLYFFVGDTKGGQTTGEGIDHFGGAWYVIDAAGKKVEHAMHASGGSAPAPPPTTTTTSGGYGY